MRWGALSVACVVALAACGDDAADRTEASSAPESEASPAPEPDVDRFSTGVRLGSSVEQLQVVGTTVLAFSDTTGDDHPDPELLRSADLGESWEPLTLPGAPDPEASNFSYTSVEAGEELTVVTAEEGDTSSYPYVAENVYLWVSRDGLAWQGGHLPAVGPPDALSEPVSAVASDGTAVAGVVTEAGDGSGDANVEMFRSQGEGGAWVPAATPDLDIEGGPTWFSDIWQTDDGRLVAVISSESSEDPLTVLESQDEGQSWQVGTCPEDGAVDADSCQRVIDAGSLEVGPQGVSVDGEGWDRPVLEPPPAEGDPEDFGFEEPLERPDGGWLVAGSVFLNQEEDLGVLTRSDDGVTWHQLFADDPCLEDDLYPEFSQPVRPPSRSRCRTPARTVVGTSSR